MTKPKGEKPVRERAPRDDESNEGAQAERDSLRAKVKRMRATAERQHDDPRMSEMGAANWVGYVIACDAMLNFLDGRSARFASRRGGLRGPGKVARRA